LSSALAGPRLILSLLVRSAGLFRYIAAQRASVGNALDTDRQNMVGDRLSWRLLVLEECVRVCVGG
jgi:hypothetical protein